MISHCINKTINGNAGPWQYSINSLITASAGIFPHPLSIDTQNQDAKTIHDAFEVQLPKGLYQIEVDDDEHVLVKKKVESPTLR